MFVCLFIKHVSPNIIMNMLALLEPMWRPLLLVVIGDFKYLILFLSIKPYCTCTAITYVLEAAKNSIIN